MGFQCGTIRLSLRLLPGEIAELRLIDVIKLKHIVLYFYLSFSIVDEHEDGQQEAA